MNNLVRWCLDWSLKNTHSYTHCMKYISIQILFSYWWHINALLNITLKAKTNKHGSISHLIIEEFFLTIKKAACACENTSSVTHNWSRESSECDQLWVTDNGGNMTYWYSWLTNTSPFIYEVEIYEPEKPIHATGTSVYIFCTSVSEVRTPGPMTHSNRSTYFIFGLFKMACIFIPHTPNYQNFAEQHPSWARWAVARGP